MISRANRGIKFLYRDVLRVFTRKERRICRISKSVARYFNNKVIIKLQDASSVHEEYRDKMSFGVFQFSCFIVKPYNPV